ncbi:M15 family metallopeptidase [Brevundimonas sp. VNH65]|uniref:M15 family metallopeptidase n=1 Tax=Brevundimonas sp. VNH65 TaxID=3400917 RepID=UPI003C2DBFBD
MLRLLAVLALGLSLLTAATARAQATDCTGDPAWAEAALANALSLNTLSWTPFNQAETGWEAYVPILQHEIGVKCDPAGGAFAAGLARFQARYDLPPTGVFDAATFIVLKGVLQERRPFVMARVRNECPDPPPLNQLGYLLPEEEHADRLTRLLRRDVLDAYRRMVEAARTEVPAIAADPELLQIFSGFRDPEADAARCAQQGNCDGVRRAACSPHRTGTAIDLYVGRMAGMDVDSTAPESRRHMSRGPAYQWLVANAGRFGFRPYLYEPWHWEYVGGGG